MGLQVTPFTMTKVIQLFETKNSRHSSMIVGNTGSGKTVTWKALQATLCSLHRIGEPSYNMVRVSGCCILSDPSTEARHWLSFLPSCLACCLLLD